MAEFDLHVFHFSTASLVARYTAVLGAKSSPSTAGPKLRLKPVNLMKGENLSEEYLALTPKGQVPILTSSTLHTPLRSSWEISDWLCDQYPALLPDTHRTTIKELLKQFRTPHVDACAMPPMMKAMPNMAEKLLQGDNLSESYRKALKAKSAFQQERASTIASISDDEASAKTKAFLDAVLDQYKRHGEGSTWIFGDETGPTALDGSIVPYLARLIDLGRNDLVGEELREYAGKARAGPGWQAVTHGRPTMWNPSMGPVELLPL